MTAVRADDWELPHQPLTVLCGRPTRTRRPCVRPVPRRGDACHQHGGPGAEFRGLRDAIERRAAIIAALRGVSAQTALSDVYAAPGIDSLYCGAPDETPASALPGVYFTARFLAAALAAGASWEYALAGVRHARRWAYRKQLAGVTTQPRLNEAPRKAIRGQCGGVL
jgi:hypothetical protein